MTLLIVSFLAGVLTIAAPCILPLLPVIIGGTATIDDGKQQNRFRPLIIISSLLVSLLVFSLLLQASTALLGVPSVVWRILSGSIVFALGVHYLLPSAWEKIALKSGLYLGANNFFVNASQRRGRFGDILLGASLGPIFTSCSPTYAYVLAAVLPESFLRGLTYLLAYLVGLAAMLFLVSYGGQSIVKKLGWLTNPKGKFLKCIGVLFIVVGLAIATGTIKQLESYMLTQGWYDPIGQFEQELRN